MRERDRDRKGTRADEMVQPVKVLATKLNDLSLILWIYMVEGEN